MRRRRPHCALSRRKLAYGVVGTVLLLLAAYVLADVSAMRARDQIVDNCRRQHSFYTDAETFRCVPVVPRMRKLEK